MIQISENDYKIRRAEYDDAAEIAGLMKEVYDGIEDKDTFICDDIEFVQRHIEKEGFILLVENRTLLGICGVFIVRYPQKADDNLGYYVNLDENELLRVAHMESSVVRADSRGHHLEYEMMKAAESLIDEKYDILMGMASPKNIASMKAYIAGGFSLVRENADYHGYRRNVYQKIRK